MLELRMKERFPLIYLDQQEASRMLHTSNKWKQVSLLLLILSNSLWPTILHGLFYMLVFKPRNFVALFSIRKLGDLVLTG